MSIATPLSPVAPSSRLRFETAEEWHHNLGDVPLSRIIFEPLPGTASESDLLQLVEAGDRLVELIDGTLVEKPVGFEEALIAANISTAIAGFVLPRKLGTVSGADSTMRMLKKQVRLPDVVFVEAAAYPKDGRKLEAIPTLPPTLAVEVISPSNTRAEMRRKRTEYFESGGKLVWQVYPETRTVLVFDRPGDEPAKVLKEGEVLDGGTVLPGFEMTVSSIFEMPYGEK